MKFTDSDVSMHNSVDNSDPGFAIKGFKLRWISGAVESRRAGRFWVPLKLSMIPEKALKKLKDSNPSWFTNGDTIRKRGDLTLACAPVALVEQRRRELRKQQHDNEAVFRGQVNLGNHVKTERDNAMAIESAGPAEQFA